MFRDDEGGRGRTAAPGVDETLGPLERRVLESLWARAAAASVRDLQPEFRPIAYTTLMTTLDRLYRKGMLERQKDGRAFRYRAKYSREGLHSELARRAFSKLLGHGRGWLRPVLSMLIDTVSERDAEALDELERLVRERRGRTRGAPDAEGQP
jgi:predicted transcriptional regulator